jgi:hypothetical protein
MGLELPQEASCGSSSLHQLRVRQLDSDGTVTSREAKSMWRGLLFWHIINIRGVFAAQILPCIAENVEGIGIRQIGAWV